MASSPNKYNNVQVTLHWLSAVLVVFMLVAGFFMLAETPNADPQKLNGLKIHMLMGGGVLVLTLVRIVWRRKSSQPAHAATGNAVLDTLGIAAHYALNILVILIAVSGISLGMQVGLAEIVFDGQGTLPVDFSAYTPRIAHGLLTRLLAALVIAHIVAGLYHQFALKDGLFKRMAFGKTDD